MTTLQGAGRRRRREERSDRLLRLLHWCNSLGVEISPTALLVNDLKELQDGIALCEIAAACLRHAVARNRWQGRQEVKDETVATCKRQLGLVELNVCTEQDALGNLSVAARVAMQLDEGRSSPALEQLLRDRQKDSLVLLLLGIFKRELDHPVGHHRKEAEQKSKDKQRIRKQSLSPPPPPPPPPPQLVRRQKTRLAKPTLNLRKQSPPHHSKITPTDTRPSWNNSVSVEPPLSPHAKQQTRSQVQVNGAGFRKGSLFDPSYSSKIANSNIASTQTAPENRSKARTGYESAPCHSKSSRRIKKTSSEVKATSRAISQTANFNTLIGLADNTKQVESLHIDHRETLIWLLQPYILPDILKSLRPFQGDIEGTTTKCNPQDLFGIVPALFSNGVVLCELARRVQIKIGMVRADQRHPTVEKIKHLSDGSTIKTLVLNGVSLNPRNHGAKVKNVSIALSIFQRLPKINSRHLFSPEAVVSCTPAASLWELLQDVRQAVPQLTDHSELHQGSESTQPRPLQRARSSSVSSIKSARSRSLSLPLPAPPPPRDDLALLSKSSQKERRRSFSGESISIEAKNLLVPNHRAGKVSRPLVEFSERNSLNSRRSTSSWKTPFLQLVTSEPPSRPLSMVDQSTQSKIIDWLVSLRLESTSLHQLEPLSDVPLLKDPLRNGCFMWELFSILEPQVKLLLESECHLNTPVKSISEAERNTRFALNAMYTILVQDNRKSTFPKDDLPTYETLTWLLRKETEFFLKGDPLIFWSLLKCLFRLYSKDFKRKRPSSHIAEGIENAVQLMNRSLSEEQEKYSSRSNDLTTSARLDRVYRETQRSLSPENSLSRENIGGVPKTILPASRNEWSKGQLLPYTKSDLRMLETVLSEWLHDLGILQKFDAMAELPLTSLFANEHIRAGLCNGVLLSDAISEALLNGEVLKGIFRNPKNPLVALKNIQKVVNFLLSREDISRRFLSNPDQILSGTRSVILGLLEDILRAQDKVPPRPIQPNVAERPYLPSHQHRVKRKRSLVLSSRQKSRSSPEDYEARHTNLFVRKNPSADIWPTPFTASDITVQPRGRSRVRQPRSKTSNNNNNSLGRGSDAHFDPNESIFSKSAVLAPREYLATGAHSVSDIIPVPRSRAKSSSFDYSISPERSSVITPGKSRSPSRSPVRSVGSSLDNDEYTRKIYNQANLGDLINWLVEEQRLVLREPGRLSDFHGTAPEFNDGVILCLLVEKIEHVRGGIHGIQSRPKTTAACLHNIRSALQILQSNKKMPTKLLWAEREIAAGKVSVIVPLLWQMRQTYR